MSQTAYTVNQLTAFAGQLGDIGPHDIGTFVNGVLTSVPFGVAVSMDPASGDGHFKSPAASGDLVRNLLLGVTAATQAVENLGSGGGYKINAAVGVMKKGRIWVQVEEAVVAGDPVFVRIADGSGGHVQKGAFRKSADTVAMVDTAAQVAEGMQYLTSAAINGFALLQVNLN